MSLSLLRNQGPSPLPLPWPFKGVVESGGARVLRYSPDLLIAALGGVSALGGGVSVSALPDNYSGAVDDFNVVPVGAIDLQGAIATYFVRPTGSNNNDGSTAARAWATIPFAISQLYQRYNNGGFVLDVTGVDETQTVAIDLPQGGIFFGSTPGSLLGFNGPFTIHSDLVNFLTVPVANIVSVVADAVTELQTITTTGGLTVNALVGKQIKQAGSVMGVVRSNTASVIKAVATGLNTLSDIVFADPGATLWDLNLTGGGAGNVIVEGCNLKSNSFVGLTLTGCAAQPYIGCCKVDTWSDSAGRGPSFFNSYISPSVEAPNSDNYVNEVVAFACFFKSVSFVSNEVDLKFDLNSCAAEACGSIGFLGNTGIGDVLSNISNCEFLNSPNQTFVFDSTGVVLIENCKIDGSGNSPILSFHNIVLFLFGIPAGVGNAGIGVEVNDGTRITATGTTALHGAVGDVKIGTLATTTWAAVTAAPGNRITDLAASLITGVVTGDGSTAHRTP